MPVSIVVGGQYGSEGKGKVAHFLAKRLSAAVAIRVGGPNSGHTVVEDGQVHVFRSLPTASLIPGIHCAIGPGAYIDVDVFLKELSNPSISCDGVSVDPNAFVITEEDRERERKAALRPRIGSTLTGTGGAVLRRIERRDTSKRAADDPRLQPYVQPVGEIARRHLQQNCRVIVEGTQGFGLSVLHSNHYPHVTSRDTTAAGFLSEVGLSPLDMDDVTLVLRSFPIRVSGNSGPLPGEIDWNTVTRESGAEEPVNETTSVTGRVRRVARFDAEVVLHAIRANSPTRVVLNHLDYVDWRCRVEERVTDKAEEFVREVESSTGVCVDWIGFGPESTYPRQKNTKQAVAL